MLLKHNPELFSDPDLFSVIHHAHPRTQDFRSESLDDFFRINVVAKTFRHFLAFSVNNHSMRNHRMVGSLFASLNSNHQRAVKPTAVLVISFQI